jgi:hypothetical protein
MRHPPHAPAVPQPAGVLRRRGMDSLSERIIAAAKTQRSVGNRTSMCERADQIKS